MSHELRFDEIGAWSEVKHEIIRKYAAAYSRVMATRRQPAFEHFYVDAFSGSGLHISRQTGATVPGSPLHALSVVPPFSGYVLIDLDGDKLNLLQQLIGPRPDVTILQGDANVLLPRDVFPRLRFQDYRRALCVFDPYGLHLDWKLVETAGRMRSIDLFLNFPVMDMNRNAIWRSPHPAAPGGSRMTAWWGDESWRSELYRTDPQRHLFGEPEQLKASNADVVAAYRRRLVDVAGFEHVPDPVPMRNSRNAVVYYLFFASHQPVAADIVADILERQRARSD